LGLASVASSNPKSFNLRTKTKQALLAETAIRAASIHLLLEGRFMQQKGEEDYETGKRKTL